jgi:general secretion pathway protein N
MLKRSAQAGTQSVVLIWLVCGVLTVLTSLLIFLPASWFALALEKQTNGRVVLGDVQGSFWRGSAFIGGAAGETAAVLPLFPGRFSWRISPAVLLGQLHVEFENSQVLSTPLIVDGSLHQWQINPGTLIVPPERLEGLGAPLNTIGPSGQLRLNWNKLDFVRQETGIGMTGAMSLDMNDMASRLSSIRPLGSYQLLFDWRGAWADVKLVSVRGPMMLEGKGRLENGRLSFSGVAFAANGQEEKLANLLNLLGQRRQDGNRDVIALEFK